MGVQESALFVSSLGLALYTGARLGIFAHKSSVALAKTMGPAGKTEAIVLSLSVVCLLATGVGYFFCACSQAIRAPISSSLPMNCFMCFLPLMSAVLRR